MLSPQAQFPKDLGLTKGSQVAVVDPVRMAPVHSPALLHVEVSPNIIVPLAAKVTFGAVVSECPVSGFRKVIQPPRTIWWKTAFVSKAILA